MELTKKKRYVSLLYRSKQINIIVDLLQRSALVKRCLVLHYKDIPANTRRWSNVGPVLGQHRRRWASVRVCWDQLYYNPDLKKYFCQYRFS